METYQDIWNVAQGDDDEHTTRAALVSAMKWVLCSFRPLKTAELLDALASDSCERFDEKILLERCSNLIVEDSSGYVRLAHLSVKHFFEDWLKANFAPRSQHSQAALSSLLVVVNFRESKEKFGNLQTDAEINEYDRQIDRDSFVLYCRTHWADHYRLSERSSDLKALLDTHRDLLNCPFDNLICWIVNRTACHADDPALGIRDVNDHVEPRQLRQHLSDAVKRTLVSPGRLAALSVDRNLARFQWISAVANSKYERLDQGSNALLCANGVMSDCHTLNMYNSSELHVRDSDADGNTVIHYAAFFDVPSVMREFVRRGGDVQAVNLSGETPLQIAATENSVDCCLELVQYGVSPSAFDLDRPRRNALEQLIKDNFVVRDPAGTPLLTRSRLRVNQSGRSCRTCDLPAWLEATRRGDRSYLASETSRVGSDGKIPDCMLCTHVYKQQDMTRDQYNDPRYSMEMKVMLDADSNLAMGRDTLRCHIPGSNNLDFEFYVTGSGAYET